MSVSMTFGNYTFDPVPLISYSRDRVRDRLNNKLYDVITLNCAGTILDTNTDKTFGALDEGEFSPLASGLGQEGAELIISHENGTFVSGVYPRVEGFAVDEGTWVNFARYNFSFVWEERPEGSGFVQEFSDEWNWSETDEDTVEVSHTVSALGLNTNPSGQSNALQNARNFIQTKLGIDKIPVGLPDVVYSLYTDKSYINRLRSEAADVATGNISITESFVFASGIANTYIDRKEFSISTSSDGISEVSVRGQIQGGGTTGFLRDQAAVSGWETVKEGLFTEASGVYDLLVGDERILNSTPTQKSLTRNKNSGIVSYDYTFSDALNENVPGVVSASFTIDDSPPIQLWVSHPIPGKLDGNHWQNVNTTTEGTYSLSGEVTGETLQDAITYAQILVNRHGGHAKGTKRRISSKSVNKNPNGKSVNFSITWTYCDDYTGSLIN